MDKTDVITILIEHYKNNLNDAEIIFEDICTSDDRPIFHLSDREVQLNPDQKKGVHRKIFERNCSTDT